jgi:hypothetical protein
MRSTQIHTLHKKNVEFMNVKPGGKAISEL